MKTDKQLNQLYKDCVEFWGIRRQIRMMQEECAELIVAGSHYLRRRATGFEKLVEELADVQLMVGQIKLFVGEKNVEKMIDKKSNYIKEKLEDRKTLKSNYVKEKVAARKTLSKRIKKNGNKNSA